MIRVFSLWQSKIEICVVVVDWQSNMLAVCVSFFKGLLAVVFGRNLFHVGFRAGVSIPL